MSKRKCKKTPNLPQETLERARQQAQQPEPESAAEAQEAEIAENAIAQPAPSRRRAAQPAPLSAERPRRKREVSYEEMDAETIADLLAHPTRSVSEDELRAQYGYVLTDLRSMALLSAALLAALVIMARLL